MNIIFRSTSVIAHGSKINIRIAFFNMNSLIAVKYVSNLPFLLLPLLFSSMSFTLPRSFLNCHKSFHFGPIYPRKSLSILERFIKLGNSIVIIYHQSKYQPTYTTTGCQNRISPFSIDGHSDGTPFLAVFCPISLQFYSFMRLD